MMLDVSTRLVTLDRALNNKQLLGAALGDPVSWTTWIACLKAAYAEPLTAAEREAFDKVAGGRQPPTRKVKEFVVAASRRAGKGRAAGALAAYASALVDHASRLAPGEVGVVAAVSPSRAQALIIKDYTLGFFERSPVLRDEIVEVVADEIRLRNRNVITTLASDYRTLRGRTLLLAILDEASFLKDETSSTPDIEAARALLPGLSTTGGMLCILSSPYRRNGLLFQRHRDHFGRDSADVLVVAGPSLAFNPTLDTAMIDAAREADPQAALSEWDGEFRSDLLQFLDDASIDAAVDYDRPLELPPRPNTIYRPFTDMSGGGPDASTICICHRDGERIIADVIRGRHGDPNAAAQDYANLCKQYRCRSITGDRYSGEWVAGGFRRCNVEYHQSALTRSDLYLEGLPLFTRGLVSIPANAVLLKELRQLERRVARSGKDSVNHGVGQHDDHSNALFGSLYPCAKAARRSALKPVMPGVFSNGQWWGDAAPANTPAPAGYRATNEPRRSYVGSRWPGSDRFNNDW
jgi:hypothetical protein